MLEDRRADPPVVSDRHQLAACAPQQRGEAAPDRACVVGAERLADHAADVVFAQDGGVEAVGHRDSKSYGSSSSSRSRAAFASCTWPLLPPRSGWTIATSRLWAV